VARIVFICAQGAAHGVWKERMSKVDSGRAATCESNCSCEVTSVMVDIVAVGQF